MVTESDFMRRALFHAGRAEGVTTPNPLVGAVIVSPDGVVVGQGRHPRAGAPHAEVFAIEDAGDRARGATMFVNLEPCCHTGRTGPCTKRIIAAGLRRVVAAMPDPNPVVSGKGFDELRAHGIEVEVGVLAEGKLAACDTPAEIIRSNNPEVKIFIDSLPKLGSGEWGMGSGG